MFPAKNAVWHHQTEVNNVLTTASHLFSPWHKVYCFSKKEKKKILNQAFNELVSPILPHWWQMYVNMTKTSSADTVALKLPAVWVEDIKTWHTQSESQLSVCNISQELSSIMLWLLWTIPLLREWRLLSSIYLQLHFTKSLKEPFWTDICQLHKTGQLPS